MKLVTIDADRLHWMNITGGSLQWVNEVDLVNAIVSRPVAHWIEHPHECGENWEFSKYECSECQCWTEYYSDFCPDCGADMRQSIYKK